MGDVVKIEKRTALMFADGSMSISPENWPMEKVHAQREESDEGCQPKERTKIAIVTVVVDEILLDPTNPDFKEFDQLCTGCSQPVDRDWSYCPYCGAQGRKRRRKAS